MPAHYGKYVSYYRVSTRHRVTLCPLCPRKRTQRPPNSMSAKCQRRTLPRIAQRTSAQERGGRGSGGGRQARCTEVGLIRRFIRNRQAVSLSNGWSTNWSCLLLFFLFPVGSFSLFHSAYRLRLATSAGLFSFRPVATKGNGPTQLIGPSYLHALAGPTSNTNTEPRHRPATADPDADVHGHGHGHDTCDLPLRVCLLRRSPQ